MCNIDFDKLKEIIESTPDYCNITNIDVSTSDYRVYLSYSCSDVNNSNRDKRLLELESLIKNVEGD